MIVSDASPIISLGKQGRLLLLKKLFGTVSIPGAVYDEIMSKADSPEAVALKKAKADGWLEVEKIATHPLLATDRIGKGEKECISLACHHKAVALIDDDLARQYASILGVETHGTLFVMLMAIRKRMMTRKQARLLLDGLISHGFFLSLPVYQEFIALLDK